MDITGPSAIAYHCRLDFVEMPFQLLAFCSPPSFFGAGLNQVPTDGRLANLNHGMLWNALRPGFLPELPCFLDVQYV